VTDTIDLAGVPPVLSVLVLAALAILPMNAPLTDLPPGADPCVALTPAVVDQLRTSGALTPLVPDAIPTSTLINAGRALTDCPPTGDPDLPTVQGRVCPLLTAAGVEALANRFGATSAVRADLGPERIAVARDALQCDPPAVTASETTTAGPDGNSTDTIDRAEGGVLEEQHSTIASSAAAFAALVVVLALVAAVRSRRRQCGDEDRAPRSQQDLPPRPGASGPGRQRHPDDRDRREGQQQSRPAGDSEMRDGHEDRPESYDELLEGLRREVTELQGTDEALRKRTTKPDDHNEQ
jgi:hypothetical protein